MVGLFVKKYEHKFRDVPVHVIPVSLAIGALQSVVSAYLFGTKELYFGSLLVLGALVCVFIKSTNVKIPSFLTALEGCSTYIYIFHIMISTVILIIWGMLGIDIYSSAILANLYPIIVCVASTVFSCVLIKVLKKVRKNAPKAHKTKVS